MDSHAKPQQPEPSIRDLFPELTEQQLQEAESNLRTYFDVALDVCAAIDNTPISSTMKERSKANLKT